MRIIDRKFLQTTINSVHAATIAFYKSKLVFSWFGGSREGATDTAIYINGLNNENNIIIGDKDLIPRWNPILVEVNGRLILFEKAGLFCDRWSTFIHDISDWNNDITRGEINKYSHMLPAGLNGPVKSCPLLIDDILYCGSSVETIYDWTSYIEQYRISDSWENSIQFISRSNPLFVKTKKSFQDPYSGRSSKSLGIIQPTLWQTGDILHAFMRSSKGLGKIYYARGKVGSEKWAQAVPTNLYNPNSAVDVVYYNDRLFLIHNPSDVKRSPLVLSEIEFDIQEDSVDCKIKYQIMITEKVDENFSLISKELSYPYMIEHDNKLHIVYTYARTKIEYIVVEIH